MCFCKQQLSLIKRTKNRMRHPTIVFHAVSCLLINALFMKWKKLKSNRSVWTEPSVQSWRCEFDRWWNINAACTRCTTRSLFSSYPHLTFRCQMDRHKYNISDCRGKIEVTTHEENGQPTMVASTATTCQQYRIQLFLLRSAPITRNTKAQKQLTTPSS